MAFGDAIGLPEKNLNFEPCYVIIIFGKKYIQHLQRMQTLLKHISVADCIYMQLLMFTSNVCMCIHHWPVGGGGGGVK